MWFIPEVGMLISSVVIFVALRSLNDNTANTHVGESLSAESLALRKQFGTFLSMVALLLAGVIRPSVPSAIYFIVFLGSATLWACFKELDRAFAIVCRFVIAFLMVHFTTYLAYQTPIPQEMFPANSTLIRCVHILV